MVQFGKQEPGTPEEIMKFVADYGVTFPLTEKVDVNGDGACDVFKWLKEATPGSENADIEWNFVKVRLHVCRAPRTAGCLHGAIRMCAMCGFVGRCSTCPVHGSRACMVGRWWMSGAVSCEP